MGVVKRLPLTSPSDKVSYSNQGHFPEPPQQLKERKVIKTLEFL